MAGLGGGGLLPIPYLAISQYARDFGHSTSPENMQEFVLLIRAMDELYIETVSTRASSS